MGLVVAPESKVPPTVAAVIHVRITLIEATSFGAARQRFSPHPVYNVWKPCDRQFLYHELRLVSAGSVLSSVKDNFGVTVGSDHLIVSYLRGRGLYVGNSRCFCHCRCHAEFCVSESIPETRYCMQVTLVFSLHLPIKKSVKSNKIKWSLLHQWTQSPKRYRNLILSSRNVLKKCPQTEP